MSDSCINLITTILGVIIGGFITIRVSNLTNIKMLRHEHILSILQRCKELLIKWSEQVLLGGTDLFESTDITEYRAPERRVELHALIIQFNVNKSSLKAFESSFDALKKRDINIQIESEKYIKVMRELSAKYNTKDVGELYKYTEVSQALTEYTEQLFNLHTDIERLIVEIDSYIDEKILK